MQNIFAAGFSKIDFSKIKDITIVPEENVLFTNSESKFILELPGVEPSLVQTNLQKNVDSVKLISSRRFEYFSNENFLENSDENFSKIQSEKKFKNENKNESQTEFKNEFKNKSGTRIEFIFSFSEPGVFELEPLVVNIQGRTFYLKFEKVQVFENPKNITPVVYVVLNNSKTIYNSIQQNQNKKNAIQTFETILSKPIEFTIYVQYATQIKSFGYEIPRDSIFEEVKRYDFLEQKIEDKKFSKAKRAVAKFSWTPLKDENYSMPNFRLLLTSYSGRNYEVGLPDCKIIVKKKNNLAEKNQAQNSSPLDYAFLQPTENQNFDEEKIFTKSDFEKIVNLRSKEKHSFINSSIRKERSLEEKKLGIVANKNETSILFWNFIFVIFLLFLIIFVLLFILRKKNLAIIFMSLAILFFLIVIILSGSAHEKHGIVIGGSICPVPENSALTSSAVSKGTCVVIKDEIPLWYFVEYNENGGWIKKENLILVE